MDPKQPWANFNGGPPESVFSPAVVGIVLVVGLLLLFLPRKKAIFAFLAGGLLIPAGQILLIGSAHFPMLRILLLFGLARIGWAKMSGRCEIFTGGMNRLDTMLILLSLLIAVNGFLLYGEFAEIIYQAGQFFSAVGTYLLLRFLIRDSDDVNRAIRALAFVTIVIAGLMSYEALTGKNLVYATFGGLHSSTLQFAGERDDKIRATGVFAHPILAGTFGGFMFPLFIGLLAKAKKGRIYLGAAALGAVVIAITSNSSTSLMGWFGGIGALCLWPMRRNMRLVRWGVIGMLIALQLYMKSPIWHIISDIDLAGGSSSWHRYMLVDQCIRHFSSWALIGTKDYGTWGLDSFDLSDQYVGTADTAGFVPLVLFLTILVLGFKYLGRMRRFAEGEHNRGEEFLVWALGASLFANVVAFFGIGYFDQIIVGWYALLAIICTVTLPARRLGPAEVTGAFMATPAYGVGSALAYSPAQAPNLESRPYEQQAPKKKKGLFYPERAVGPNRFK